MDKGFNSWLTEIAKYNGDLNQTSMTLYETYCDNMSL